MVLHTLPPPRSLPGPISVVGYLFGLPLLGHNLSKVRHPISALACWSPDLEHLAPHQCEALEYFANCEGLCTKRRDCQTVSPQHRPGF